ncbi:HDL178Wp [Eremothecium sinecaudum]|uniref:HDL178Wp n=1 Tax=Eremothecium sinecaudum TaxID=45286 RepID=A0A109UZ13_9SACH|nr:HDL178Wp [Eremothecium sinecaudum]AMD20566.1 HDL178Wp [Eremothecium sinecaudum]
MDNHNVLKADVTKLDDDLKALRNSKFGPDGIEEIKIWIFSVLNEEAPEGPLLEALRDGVVLCRLANELHEEDTGIPNHIKWKRSKKPFVQMEQISLFLDFMLSYGVREDEVFRTIDLYEGNDPSSVYLALISLSRYANQKHPEKFPVIGRRRVAKKKPREPVETRKTARTTIFGWTLPRCRAFMAAFSVLDYMTCRHRWGFVRTIQR